ncbi:M15 family metallopeptidase [Bradyrhizobium brasilense]|uniref:M15 family metallopeptidase n=1 Tax=Bradyrhizobium brasilense TaxID=1419277 RepID=UPI0024B1C557|nr:M15 family metallopeptidase [Bradyrhizobium australafricanum]WFU33721.1 M15 family metallopeptidase [Bradyrhizobium australafricanum]
MHGYAAAIDLNLEVCADRLWAGKGKSIPYENRMPREIVDIFERHGFIWGGKWGHYDTVHRVPAGASRKVKPLAGGVLTPS